MIFDQQTQQDGTGTRWGGRIASHTTLFCPLIAGPYHYRNCFRNLFSIEQGAYVGHRQPASFGPGQMDSPAE